ncbi:MAG: hypothetical protein V4538_15200 [Bacteroidota bacterium]
MSLAIDIFGSLIRIDNTPKEIEDWGTDNPKEQYWRRKELPDFFDEVEYDKDGVALLTPEQAAYSAIEVERCRKGFSFYNNGIVTYITGKNYFYLQWWKLEDDIYPDYRDADRRYFLFLNYWEAILWCIFIVRGKKRREGASSQACSNLMYECIFYKSSNCGLVSKEEKDSRETFLEMVSFGYQQLPPFLKPRQLNRADSVTEFIFAGKAEKGENSGKKGNKSKINYRTPKENAYDRGRMSRVLGDEGGKWPIDIKFSKFISKVSKTLIKGAKRVGFMECPSTVNEMTKGGGAEYKKVWDGCDQFISGGKKTPLRGVTYFTPSYDNYEGFIDKYGMSVMDAPDEETYDFLVKKWVVKDQYTGETISEISEEDIKLGAKVYIASRRVGLTGDLLEEEIRQNPTTVQEMFEAANIGCTFNSYNINQRKRELEENQVYKRKILYTLDEETQKVKWRDITPNEKNFYWEITWGLDGKITDNKWVLNGNGQKSPGRSEDGAISVDSYSNSQGGRKYGSKACALIGRRSDLLDPENTGKPIGMLYGRPAEKDILHYQVMLAGIWFGYPIWYEHTADDYWGYFKDRGRLGYLGKYPKSLIDPTKRETQEQHKGTPITPFSLTKQLDYGISFFENHCDKIDWVEILDNALIFDPYDRTKFDIIVSFLILISVLMERPIIPPPKTIPLIPVFDGNGQLVMN